MIPRTGGVVAVVLAAGAASRFGATKVLAPLDGRPLLQHVLDTLAAAGLPDVIVVLGGSSADEVEAALTWRGERVVRNPDPARGLASSVREGLAALPGNAEAALVVLGDQPLLRADVIRAVLGAWQAGAGPIVAPRYAGSGTLNPVLLARPAWARAGALEGDRGFGPLIHASPELVARVDVPGDNPDVDTPDDLARLAAEPAADTPGEPPGARAEAAWAARVRANRDQVDRFREVPDGRDFYRPTSSLFRADPFRTNDAVLDQLLALARPEDTWLDIGAGAGRFALPIALHVREVIALDPSAGMLRGLSEGMEEHGIRNVRVIEGRWPADASGLRADVSLIAHVSYDVEAIGAFLGAMESASRRLCVAVLMEQAPSSMASPFWPAIHGEERIPLPALADLVDVLGARGRTPHVTRIAAESRSWASADELLVSLRQQLWVQPGGEKDRRLVALVDALPREPDGAIRLTAPYRDLGVVTWAPPAAGA